MAGPALLVQGCGESESGVQARAAQSVAPEISLEASIVAGDDNAVRDHIMAGTSVNTPNAAGNTPLSIAAALGRTYAAEVLIDAGADIEIKNGSGVTPLFNAAFFCQVDVLRALIHAGANTKTTDQNGIPIHQIIELLWEQIEPAYTAVYRAIGIPLDAEHLKSTRPEIAAMLR